METVNNNTAGSDLGLSHTETQALLLALASMRRGDFTQLLPESVGPAGEVADGFNALAEHLQTFAVEASRLAVATGVHGDFGAQLSVEHTEGTWKDLTENLNHMSLILAAQVRDVARVAGAVAEGDLSQKVTVVAAGEMAGLKESFNTMIDQLQVLKDSVNALMARVSEMGGKSQQNGQMG